MHILGHDESGSSNSLLPDPDLFNTWHTLTIHYPHPSTASLSNPLRRGSRGWGMFLHQNHGAGGGKDSVMVGMFVCLCLASKKPSEREFFVPARTNLAVLMLRPWWFGADNIFGRQEGSPCRSLMHSRYRKVFHKHVFLLIYYVMNSTDITTNFQQHAGQDESGSCNSVFLSFQYMTYPDNTLSTPMQIPFLVNKRMNYWHTHKRERSPLTLSSTHSSRQLPNKYTSCW
jgi:hypothetical protein